MNTEGKPPTHSFATRPLIFKVATRSFKIQLYLRDNLTLTIYLITYLFLFLTYLFL